jgi:hypothetical protein
VDERATDGAGADSPAASPGLAGGSTASDSTVVVPVADDSIAGEVDASAAEPAPADRPAKAA